MQEFQTTYVQDEAGRKPSAGRACKLEFGSCRDDCRNTIAALCFRRPLSWPARAPAHRGSTAPSYRVRTTLITMNTPSTKPDLPPARNVPPAARSQARQGSGRREGSAAASPPRRDKPPHGQAGAGADKGRKAAAAPMPRRAPAQAGGAPAPLHKAGAAQRMPGGGEAARGEARHCGTRARASPACRRTVNRS